MGYGATPPPGREAERAARRDAWHGERRRAWVECAGLVLTALDKALVRYERLPCGADEHHYPIRSVLDIGCGPGAWLEAIRRRGVMDCVGVDQFPPLLDSVTASIGLPLDGEYRQHDLRTPLDLERRFDLVLCLEVAEHIDAGSEEVLFDTIAHHGDLVLFSAAIPGQGGDGHVNEQWPDHWARLFAKRGYQSADLIRMAIWDDERIAWWYRQNAVIYFRPERFDWLRPTPLRSIVHPLCYQSARRR